jgi:hypothetical protein
MNKVEELKLAYRRTFGTDDGAQVLGDLKKRFSFETTTFVSGDPHQSAFAEGQRAAVLTIVRMLAEERSPEQENK